MWSVKKSVTDIQKELSFIPLINLNPNPELILWFAIFYQIFGWINGAEMENIAMKIEWTKNLIIIATDLVNSFSGNR